MTEPMWQWSSPIVGFGIEGFRDRALQSPQTVAFYPAVATKSKFNPDFMTKSLSEEFTDFLEKYESVVYISFGTTFMPPSEQMLKVVDMIKLADKTKIGFIIFLMEHADSF